MEGSRSDQQLHHNLNNNNNYLDISSSDDDEDEEEDYSSADTTELEDLDETLTNQLDSSAKSSPTKPDDEVSSYASTSDVRLIPARTNSKNILHKLFHREVLRKR